MKPRRDITLGEMQDECKKYWNNGNLGSCGKCQYMEVCCHYEAYAPARLNLADPPRFNEAQMALLRGWFDFGARSIARESADPNYVTLYGEPAVIVGLMKQSGIADELPVLKRITLAELLGKDGDK